MIKIIETGELLHINEIADRYGIDVVFLKTPGYLAVKECQICYLEKIKEYLTPAYVDQFESCIRYKIKEYGSNPYLAVSMAWNEVFATAAQVWAKVDQ